MNTTGTGPQVSNAATGTLTYDVFVNDPPPQNKGSFRTGSQRGSPSRAP